MEAPLESEPVQPLLTGDAPSEAGAAAEPEQIVIESRGRRGPLAPQARDFDALALILKVVGVYTTFCSLLFLLAGAPYAGLSHYPYGWAALAMGFFFVAAGYGLAAYQTWAWYAAALVMPVFVVGFSILSVIEMATNMFWFYFLPFPAVFTIYVLWVLFSKGGRARYRFAGEARRRAKSNPDSVAGRLYRRR
ncbi:MAG TPA: hypothetical protein VFI31_23050 [Pirellulales bacterium]|nr:hypothetical protein [Pirellulales bacterium]